MILRLDSKLIAWDIQSWKHITWKIKTEIRLVNDRRITGQYEGNKDYFEYNGVKSFKCMTVLKNKIAIGTDSEIIIITKDTLIKINSADLSNATSLAFDPKGENLFIGSSYGSLCRMSLTNFSIECNQYQTSRISNIALDNDGSYLASANFDGTIALWHIHIHDNWNTLLPLRLIAPIDYNSTLKEANSVYCAVFNTNSEYLLAGYKSGKILKWPVSMDKLAELICTKADTTLNATILKKYINKEATINEVLKYECKKH